MSTSDSFVRAVATPRGPASHGPADRTAGADVAPSGAEGISRRRFAALLLLIVLVALGLRLVFPVADPPARPTVGIVWHDEGAWVHNARNRALFGAWSLDQWNPMYVTPVLTGLEYVSFRLFGVGLRQARLVPELLGVLSVWLIGLGVARTANRLAGLIAASLLATNFVYVMYDRAATIEGTMVAFLVVAWYGYAKAKDQPRWALLAGAGAMLAYLTKASAVFFVAALGIDALLSIAFSCEADSDGAAPTLRARLRASLTCPVGRAGAYTIAGLAAASCVALAVFVVPHWQEYRFYNWQISVTRKPNYALRAFVDRASQLPLTADFFSRMWLVLVLGTTAAISRLAAFRKLAPAERLLVWWVGLGVAELIVHDIQERRLVLLIPALAALAAITLGRDRRLVSAPLCRLQRRRAIVAAPVVAYALYMMFAAVIRLPFVPAYSPGEHPAAIVRIAALAALAVSAALYATWGATAGWLSRQRWTAAAAVLIAALAVAGDLAQFAQWSAARTYKNYDAMVRIGKWLPAGTLVHGKLANGLDLENTIRPVFVGRGFGNYDDRRTRSDIRYVLTYTAPFLGYEGGRDQTGRPIIRDVLDAHPGWRVIHTFDLAESDWGDDAGALIDKAPAHSTAPGGEASR